MQKGRQKKPNILLVLLDDAGYGDFSCFDSQVLRTPVIDEIADNGVKFTQMYSPAPICSPARCGLMTGRYPQKVGIPRVIQADDRIGLTEKDKTVAEYLKTCGYATAIIGKWHLGCCEEHNPTKHGFDYFYGSLHSNDMTPFYLYRNQDVIKTEVDQKTLIEDYTNQAIEFIEKHKSQPFFCYLAHNMPHIPINVPEHFRGKSQGGTYGDAIECIDFYLGKIIETLRRHDLEKDTLVIVTSDNGPWFEGSTGELRGRKFEVYEGGVRMPFVASWPNVIPAGITCTEPASFIDLLPTFVHLAGGDITDEIDGRNIFPLFLGKGKSPHEALYFYVINNLNAIRVGDWKLHVATGTQRRRSKFQMPQLFNLKTDPGENYNLAGNYPDVVRKLTKMIEEFDKSVQPIKNYEINPVDYMYDH